MSTATKQRAENPFDRGEPAPKPSLACLGTVASIEDGKTWDNGTSYTFRVLLNTIGDVPTKASGSIRIVPFFLKPGFKRDSLAELEGGDKLDKTFNENFATREGGDGIPTLLGYSSVDYDKYAAVGTALKNLWPELEKGTEPAGLIKGALETLIGNEVGFWLVQGAKATDEINPDTGKAQWRRTGFYNVGTPRFEKASFFKPDAKGRAYILDHVAKRASKVDQRTGEPYLLATFDEGTAF